MTLIFLAYLGGVLTILSPCILPVLPFVFARAGQPFVRSTLPMLCGMAATFALVAALAAVGGSWAVHANQYGRYAALLMLTIFGLALVFPALSDRLARPLVAIGGRLSQSSGEKKSSAWSSLLLGIGTGLLWAPCAGPILGLVLTGAALHGANVGTLGLLFAYALGAATSLAIALLIGGRIFQAMKSSLGTGEWVRRSLGVLVLAAVAAIALGLDTGLLSRVSTANTTSIEQSLLERIFSNTADSSASPTSSVIAPGQTDAMMAAAPAMTRIAGKESLDLPVEGTLPSLDGAVEWLNSPPLNAEGLRGKVVLIDFWTYSCVNCLRTLPYVRAWAEKYKDQGLVVIGVHSPEFAFEKDIDNVRRAIADLKIGYPVAVDNNYAIWRAFNNQYWPAHYFIDAQGRIRHHHFGEGEYAQSEQIIQQLLAEAGANQVSTGIVAPDTSGAALAPAAANVQSPETYIGYERAANFASPGGAIQDESHSYAPPTELRTNDWGLTGTWIVADEKASLVNAGGGITYRFHARDLNLVLGPASDGKPIRFQVRIDGKPPAGDHGVDTDAEGRGVVTGQRLYQLLRVQGDVRDHRFDIEFIDPGVEAFAFTFG
jgi:cytochrome c biogenesis protein CcdA/thiol-disulfide isomerase/thioredoxin